MKILAFTKYSYEGPSSRYRFYNYQECFEKKNIIMNIKPLFSSRYFHAPHKIIKLFVVFFSYLKRLILVSQVLVVRRRYDIVLVEYELFPYLPAWFEYLLKKRGVKYIVDYDDAIFHKYNISSNNLIRGILKNKIAKVMEYADHVIVCNEYLESYATKYNTHTLRLPTVVQLDKYKGKMKTFQKEEDTFIIGWIGSRTTSVYVMKILPAIKSFVEKYENVRFNLVGFDESLITKEDRESHHINFIPWSEEKEITNILSFDVGVMPLNDDPWSRGKCGFKLVQYMSCKKPVIASRVGMNCDLVEENTNGYLVETLDEWFEAFDKLYLNEELREKMSENNFTKIETEYNHKKNCQKYVKLLQERV